MNPSSLSSRNLVILTGAGISAESGLATFRGADGLWEGHRVEDVASPEGYVRNPELVQRFYNLRRAALATVQPNAAHLALARLEREWQGEFLLVTQNVDDLHERAGSERMVHMHGELLRGCCTACEGDFPWTGDMGRESVCPACQRTGQVRPDIVWFGEVPYHMERIADALSRCALFLSVGTSGQVYPAAGFVQAAARAGAHTVEANLDSTATSPAFHEHRTGLASQVLPALVEEWLA